MSGIAGVYHVDGQPAQRSLIEQMTCTIAHRGPDGGDIWCSGPVGLGHRMLWTTPESLHERLPLANQAGDLVITADARIDNRDELLACLDSASHRLARATDSELILAAYEKWGESCPERLLGDFAFAIWNGREQTLFCARDHFGVKPFVYYHRPGRILVFGSEIKVLLAAPEVPHRLNELKVGEYLALATFDKSSTYYQDIFRLPPAHCMTVTPEGVRVRTYWSLDPSYELQLGSDEEYAEAFREVFTEAVRCRLRSAYPVASSLSGGLDSSAIACVAGDILRRNGDRPLITVSSIYDEVPECDERPFINAVLAQGDFDAHYVHGDRVSPLHDLEKVFWHEDGVLPAPTLWLIWELCRLAQTQGARIILDGVDGDTSVSHGDEYLADLGRSGQWDEFAKESRAICQVANQSYERLFQQRYGLPALTHLATHGRWLAVARGIIQLSQLYDLSRRKLFLNYFAKPLVPQRMRQFWRGFHRASGSREEEAPLLNGIVNRQFARQMDLPERVKVQRRHMTTPPNTAREEHLDNVTSGLIPLAFEMTDRAAAACSLEARHPFYDKRVVEFCLALPPQQKIRNGWNRYIMRQALSGILPEEIQWRGGKTSNSSVFNYSFLKFESRTLDKVISDGAQTIGEYVDMPALRAAYQSYVAHQTGGDEMRVWSAVVMSRWLRYTGLDRRQRAEESADIR